MLHHNRYLIEWIFCLFAKSLPLEPTAWIWDQVLVLGDQLIFQCALGLLQLLEPRFLTMHELSDVAVVLKVRENENASLILSRCAMFLATKSDHLPRQAQDTRRKERELKKRWAFSFALRISPLAQSSSKR